MYDVLKVEHLVEILCLDEHTGQKRSTQVLSLKEKYFVGIFYTLGGNTCAGWRKEK